jgi:ABC-type nickel/cobalt efflux system permease component RcnA
MPGQVQFQDRLSTALLAAGSRPDYDHQSQSQGHSHEHGHEHGHDHHANPALTLDPTTGIWTPVEHGHTHEHLENPGQSRSLSWETERRGPELDRLRLLILQSDNKRKIQRT